MKIIVTMIILVILVTYSVPAQQSIFQDTLLDHMTGRWTLQGSIDGKETIHDIAIEWVLGHQYIQIQEKSHEKAGDGNPIYEAIVYVGRDLSSKGYDCLWLDCTGGGGLSAQAIGHAPPGSDKIAFVFKGGSGSLFHTTFIYDNADDTWQWQMDDEENGKLQPFARVKLTRK